MTVKWLIIKYRTQNQSLAKIDIWPWYNEQVQNYHAREMRCINCKYYHFINVYIHMLLNYIDPMKYINIWTCKRNS